MNKSKKIAEFGVLIALAFILSYVEAMFPINIGIPGVKLGLANLVVVVALYLNGNKDAFFISIIRIILVGFTFGSLYSLIYSLAGGILSYTAMIALKRTKHFGILGVSVIGGITHNIGQILIAICVVQTVSIAYYMPILLIAGVMTGMLIGIIAGVIVNRIVKIYKI